VITTRCVCHIGRKRQLDQGCLRMQVLAWLDFFSFSLSPAPFPACICMTASFEAHSKPKSLPPGTHAATGEGACTNAGRARLNAFVPKHGKPDS
jgi:hypothetical protein